MILPALLVLDCLGCRSQVRGQDSRSPSLVLVDTVLLEQTDSSFIGRPTAFKVADDGTYLISDWRNFVVHRYSPAGRHIQTYGEFGQGPGQFVGVSENAAGGDSLLFVNGGAEMAVFDLRTGRFKWKRRLPLAPTTFAGTEKGVYFGYVNRRRRSTVGFVDGESDSLAYGGPFPVPLGVSKYVDGPFSKLRVARIARPDTIVLALQSSDYLFVGPFHGPFDSAAIAVVRRRGSRQDLLRKVRDENVAFARSVLFRTSAPWSVGRLSNGTYAYVALDDTILPGKKIFSGTAFVSVVDVQRHRSCVDTPIPAAREPVPYVALKRDSLLVLVQYVANARPIAVVRKYLLKTDTCDWIAEPVSPAGEGARQTALNRD